MGHTAIFTTDARGATRVIAGNYFTTLALHTFDAFGVICVARNFSSVQYSFLLFQPLI
jgi:hypothetical protein